MVNVSKLKSVMVLSGFSQIKLAKCLGMSKNTLNAKINGRAKIWTIVKKVDRGMRKISKA